MENAQSTDYETEPLPTQHVTVTLGRTFSEHEMQHICAGLIPRQQEDKWFIYWKDDSLYFHRSWTGFCVYVARFAKEGDDWKMVEADVNRDTNQYSETDDEHDRQMIAFLIDLLLLHQEADFPCDNSDHSAIREWSLVGRAMFGGHPER